MDAVRKCLGDERGKSWFSRWLGSVLSGRFIGGKRPSRPGANISASVTLDRADRNVLPDFRHLADQFGGGKQL